MPAMHAVRFHEYGPPQRLLYEEAERPVANEEQLLVRVRAAGVNPFDWKVRRGDLKDSMPLALPSTPGIDVAGVVEAVGPGVTDFNVGDEIYGRTRTGSYAEYAVASVATVALKPTTLDFEQAASIPTGIGTAFVALEKAQLQRGARLLVQGAAGGVGNLIVQLAQQQGLSVIGTASTANVDFVRSLGADDVIDYTTTKFEDVVVGVDAVIDTVGGETANRSLTVIKDGGVIVEIAGPVDADRAAQRDIRVERPSARTNGDVLRRAATMVDAGQLRVTPPRIFPLTEAAQAHELSETRHGRGRIVLSVSGERA